MHDDPVAVRLAQSKREREEALARGEDPDADPDPLPPGWDRLEYEMYLRELALGIDPAASKFA